LMGGLHDYVDRLSVAEITDYILQKLDLHPELNNPKALNELSVKYGVTKETTPEVQGEKLVGKGGLHDYIWRTPRDKLVIWALTAEAHHRDVNNLRLLGGLHDYISTLSNQEITEYIMKEAQEHPEINSGSALDDLSMKFNISYFDRNAPVEQVQSVSAGGLHDYIWNTPRDTLVQWALSAEKFDRETRKVRLMGGLHDYVDRLSNEEVAEYIMKKVELYPELNSGDFLNSLVAKYEITYTPHAAHQGNIQSAGGLHDYIWRLPREQISLWALATEKYTRAKENLVLMGGLHDYIGRLSNQEIIDYILTATEKYPDLNSSDFLNTLVDQYQITDNHH